jgi:hypothetical protein
MGNPSFLGKVLALWWSGVRGETSPRFGGTNLAEPN